MVALPPAPQGYLMGGTQYDDQKDAKGGPHLVRINYQFEMGETEVTVGQYLQCVEERGCAAPQWHGMSFHFQDDISGRYAELGYALTYSRNPVVGVSWFNASQYAAWVTRKAGLDASAANRFRLPSESEWEYAARAENASPSRSTVWGHGDDESRLDQFAWSSSNSGRSTQTVRTKAANGFGLFDMAGNVLEWAHKTATPATTVKRPPTAALLGVQTTGNAAAYDAADPGTVGPNPQALPGMDCVPATGGVPAQTGATPT